MLTEAVRRLEASIDPRPCCEVEIISEHGRRVIARWRK